MSRDQRARAIIDLIMHLAVEHGTRASSKNAPPGWSGQFINIHPAWNAVLTRQPASDVQSLMASNTRRESEPDNLLANSIALWINDTLAFSADFDDERQRLRIHKFRAGDWDEQLLDWAAAWLERGSATGRVAGCQD